MSKLAEAAGEQFDFVDASPKEPVKAQVPAPQAAPPPPMESSAINLPSAVDTSVSAPVPTYLPMGEEAQMLSQWATMVAASPYYQKAGGKAGILSMWLAAKELGIPPMSALNGGLYYVQGQVTMSARMMNTLIRQRGHSINKIQGTAEVCHLRGKRRDNGDVAESVFTMKQAVAAGLTKNPVWKSYPERMLFNRALSNLAKDLFADCIGTAYVEGELDDIPMNASASSNEISSEVQAFIDKHNLLDEDSEMSKFIDRIASTLSKDRRQVIEDAASDEKKFLDSFENYKKKKK